ncbi:hypothetical protein [Sporomusa acidovorans]|uniref:Uncharacterized protein n=1 Tax=Sporomusa acidovorans (strain ATCC 49682 / DSM 3132 / Mol) TaxID=1123286 RepID=A0ABZ3IW98_SPOA4|nr:hypothetical protein [Sporomusa acidovorans]OZC23655.1 hypothetical protein SPACI_05570 [Sporomusa acidovorans DSM 3132]SDE24054.1 hypothetical protein SAMN04488499_101083 [Sporomusa acidovorans]
MDYFDKKRAILNDRMLSDAGKKSKISELQKQTREELLSEQNINKTHIEAVRGQINEMRKSKFVRPLPKVSIPNHESMASADIGIATLLAQSVALAAEQRSFERLITKLSMADTADKFLAAVSDAIQENPAAVVRGFLGIKQGFERFDINGTGLRARLNQLYNEACTAEQTPQEKKWIAANATKLEELQRRETLLFTESMNIEQNLQILSNDISTEKGKDWYFGGGKQEAKESAPYGLVMDE